METQEQLVIPPKAPVRGSLSDRYDHRLDPKRRFSIPLRWYELMGSPEHVVARISLTGKPFISICSAEVHERRLRPYRHRDAMDETQETFLRMLSESSERLKVDCQNRIRLSDEMLEYAGLGAGADDNVVLVGAVEDFEVWSLANRPKKAANDLSRIKELAELAKVVKFKL